MKGLLKTYGPAALSGALLAFSFPNWGLFLLAWLALVPLLYAARAASTRRAFALFFVAGWLFHSLVLQWLLVNFYWTGGWAFLAQQALCCLYGAFWGLLGIFWVRAGHNTHPAFRPCLLALLWIVLEFAQAHLFTGFGWTALAYSQGPDLPLLQWAAVGSASLVSAILVAFNALLAYALTSGPRPGRLAAVGAALALLIVSHLGGAALMDAPPEQEDPVTVGLFQSNFPLEMKWDPEYTVDMVSNAAQKSSTLALATHVDLLVWPETLIMDEIEAPAILNPLKELTQSTDSALFTGAQRTDAETGGTRNSSHLVDATGELAGYYDKIHLAPFGEYAPLDRYLPFVREWIPAISDIEPGETPTLFPVRDHKFGPLICFEVVFPQMAEKLRRQGADFLVVITNLGWFGASNALGQEINIARLRAIETRLPLVHCANTGISGVFDPWGRFTGLVDSPVFINRLGEKVRLYDDVTTEDLNQYRCAGALTVAAPAQRPVPWNPPIAPKLALAILVLFAAWSKIRKKRNRPNAQGMQKRPEGKQRQT